MDSLTCDSVTAGKPSLWMLPQTHRGSNQGPSQPEYLPLNPGKGIRLSGEPLQALPKGRATQTK